MLGFNPSIWLMFKMLQILDNQTNYISSEHLLDLLENSNISQVKKLLRELKDHIEERYPEKEIHLSISKRNGIKLKRHPNSDLQQLFNSIASTDLAYNVYKTLLFERKTSTSEFYEQNFISLSTLQRKIKEINSYLNVYGLHITQSQQLTLHGKESAIRSFAFIFLYMMPRQLSNIYWVENTEHYLNLAKELNRSLDLGFFPTQEEVLGIHLFINDSAINANSPFDFSEEEFPYFNDIGFPTKPYLLKDWPEDDWHFLLLMMYTSNLVNYDIQLDFSTVEFTELNKDFHTWIRLFEKYFVPFDTSKTDFLYDNFLKLYLGNFFFTVDDELLVSFPGLGLTYGEQAHPYYLTQFKKFWQDFSSQSGDWVQSYFRQQSLLLCEYLLPKTNFLPEIQIYLYADIQPLLVEHIKGTIETYFAGHYVIDFVNHPAAARLIIGTVQFEEAPLKANQKLIRIHVPLTQNDFKHLDDAINDLLIETSLVKTYY